MHVTLRLLLALYVLPILISTKKGPKYKVGLLIPKDEIYKDALKSLSQHAVDQQKPPSFSLVTEEYDNTNLKGVVDACCNLVKAGVSVVVSKSSSSDTAIQSDIFSPLKIPHIAVSATDPFLWNESREFLLRLSAPDSYQSKAIFDLIKKFKWPEVIILATTDSYGLNGMVKLQSLLHSDNAVKIRDFILIDQNLCDFTANTAAEPYKTKLQDIKVSMSNIIVLNVAKRAAKCIFKSANELGLMGPDYAWIVTDSVASDSKYLATEEGNYLSMYKGLLGIRPFTERTKARYNKVRDWYIRRPEGRLDDLTSYALLTYDAMGLIDKAFVKASANESIDRQEVECSTQSYGWDQGKKILDYLVNTAYWGISGQINLTKEDGRENPIYEIVNFVDDGFTAIGKWGKNRHKVLTMTKPQFFNGTTEIPAGIANDLKGRKLRLGTMVEEPFMFYETEKPCKKKTTCWTGLVNDMVVQLASELGFTYEYVKPPGGMSGHDEGGEFNGLVEDLLAGNTDMIALDISTSTHRRAKFDFSFPFMTTGLGAVMAGESRDSIFFFLEPFSGLIWGMIGVMNFALVIVICCLGKLSPYGKYGAKLFAVKTCSCEKCRKRREEMGMENCSLGKTNKHDCLIEKVEDDDRSKDTSLRNSLWLIGTGLVAQTGEKLPYCFSGRFMVLIWWAFNLIACSLYKANLTTALTLSSIGIPVNSILDLLEQDKYKWGFVSGRFPETLLQKHEDPRYAKLVERGESLRSMEEGIQKVRDGNFVFIDEIPILAYFKNGACQIVDVGDQFQSFEYAFGMPEVSPYKHLIDKSLLKLRENGVIESLWKKWSSVGSQCQEQGMGSKVTLDTGILAGLFISLGAGVALSVIAVLVEFVYVIIKDTKHEEGLTVVMAFKRRMKLIFPGTSVGQEPGENEGEKKEKITKEI